MRQSNAPADPVYPVCVDTNVMAGRTGQTDSSGRYAGLVIETILFLTDLFSWSKTNAAI